MDRYSRASLLSLAAASLAACATAAPPPPPPPVFPASLPANFEVVGRGPVTETHTSDLWVFRGVDGRDYAYTGTWGDCDDCFGDRMYVWDVTDPSAPVLTDSVVVDARTVNDVKVNDEGTVAVITREGASNLRNGIVILDLADPAHPTIASDYWERLTGGVHNTYIDGKNVYAVDNGTGDLRIIDISDIHHPREIGRWGVPTYPGKYLNDVYVEDGLAYLAYWNDGLIILDVGKGIDGGSPEKPEFVSQIRYRTTYREMEFGNTSTAFPYTNRAGNRYVFVGDEIITPDFDVTENDVQPAGFVHVIDISDIDNPVQVARYEVEGAGVHNLWVHDDTLYAAYYNAGLRAVDVSGDLQGDLRAQGREIAALATTDDQAFIEDRPFAWGPQWYDGLIYVSDYNSGLWIARLNRGR